MTQRGLPKALQTPREGEGTKEDKRMAAEAQRTAQTTSPQTDAAALARRQPLACHLYTSAAADDILSVELGDLPYIKQ